MFLCCRQRSREESPEWICESRCRQVSVRLHVCICGIFWPLNLSTATVYARSAFYPSLHFTLSLQSAVCILHSVCILPLVRSLQSAVRSLRFTLTDYKHWFRAQVPI